MISGSEDSRINIWHLNGTLEKTIDKFGLNNYWGHNGHICILSVSDTGILFSGSRDSFIKLWFMSNFSIITTLPGGANIRSIKSLSGNRFAYAIDYHISVLSYPSYDRFPHITLLGQNIQVIEYIAETEMIIAGLDTGYINFYNAITGIESLLPLKDHTAAITDLKKINKDYFASSSKDNTITVWSLLTKSNTKKLTGHSNPINTLAVLNETILVSGSDDHTIKFWNIITGNQIRSIDTKFVVYSLLVLRDGNVASSLQNGKIIIWDSNNGAFIREMIHTTSSVSVFPLIYYPYDAQKIETSMTIANALTGFGTTHFPHSTHKAQTTATSVLTESTKTASISISHDETTETVSATNSTQSSLSQFSQIFEPYSNRFRLIISNELPSLVNRIKPINTFLHAKKPFKCVKKCVKYADCGLVALTESKECTLFRIEIIQNLANHSFENMTLIYKRLN